MVSASVVESLVLSAPSFPVFRGFLRRSIVVDMIEQVADENQAQRALQREMVRPKIETPKRAAQPTKQFVHLLLQKKEHEQGVLAHNFYVPEPSWRVTASDPHATLPIVPTNHRVQRPEHKAAASGRQLVHCWSTTRTSVQRRRRSSFHWLSQKFVVMTVTGQATTRHSAPATFALGSAGSTDHPTHAVPKG